MLSKHSEENIVLQAVMDEFEENREKGNLTAELLNREKVRYTVSHRVSGFQLSYWKKGHQCPVQNYQKLC